MERNERIKRSIDPSSKNNLENGTIKFHNTVDEINEGISKKLKFLSKKNKNQMYRDNKNNIKFMNIA